MTLDETIERYTRNAEYERTHGSLQGCLEFRQLAEWLKELKQLRKQRPCGECINRQAVLNIITEQERLASDRVRDTPSSLGNGLHTWVNPAYTRYSTQLSERSQFKTMIQTMPPVTPQSNIGYCKDCKYFEYDSVAKVDGIPLIVAHEICKRWGDGCKTKEDGYCFLYEPQERSE